MVHGCPTRAVLGDNDAQRERGIVGAFAVCRGARQPGVVLDWPGVGERMLAEDVAERDGGGAYKVALAVFLLGVGFMEDLDGEFCGIGDVVAGECVSV